MQGWVGGVSREVLNALSVLAVPLHWRGLQMRAERDCSCFDACQVLDEDATGMPPFSKQGRQPAQRSKVSDIHQSERSDGTLDSDDSGLSSPGGFVQEETDRLDLDRIRARCVFKSSFRQEPPSSSSFWL